MTINLNRIRSLKTLETIRKPLADFVTFDPAIMVEVYETEFEWGAEDYEADKDKATELIENIDRRMKSLSHYLTKGEQKTRK